MTFLVLLAPAAFAQNGGGLKSGTSSAATTSTINVTIPAVVGIDIESDVDFDLTSHVVSGTQNSGNGCP